MATTATINEGRDFALPRTYLRAAHSFSSESLLRELRSLTPRRGLSPAEARVIAERQALLLLKRLRITDPSVPTSALDGFDSIEVAYRENWPTSGMTRNLGDGWAVIIKSSEPKVRQRFTLAHEFKHILDDPFIEWLYPTVGDSSPEDRGEAACDYFAGCLLMPKVWLRRDWTSGNQDIPALARSYAVSTRAMEVRLSQLGLLEPRPRCGGSTRQGSM